MSSRRLLEEIGDDSIKYDDYVVTNVIDSFEDGAMVVDGRDQESVDIF